MKKNVEVAERLISQELWACPHCAQEITEKSLFCDGQDWFHRPCLEEGPIQLPGEKEGGSVLSRAQERVSAMSLQGLFSAWKSGDLPGTIDKVVLAVDYLLSSHGTIRQKLDHGNEGDMDDVEALIGRMTAVLTATENRLRSIKQKTKAIK